MQYPILIQNPEASHFTASAIGIPNCVAEGTTEMEALDRAKALLEEQLAKGKVVLVDVPKALNGNTNKVNPLMECAGMWANDPFFDEFIAEMKKIREEEDQEEQT